MLGLGTGRVHLSRTAPVFGQPDEVAAALSDPVPSRRPLIIEELPAGNFGDLEVSRRSLQRRMTELGLTIPIPG